MKQKFLIKTMLLLCALTAGSRSVWGQVTIWSEDFSGYSANAVPSGTISLPHTGTSLNASGTLTYACTDATGTKAGTTYIYDEALAGGTKPEILIGKKGTSTGATPGTFTATIPLDNISGTITLSYKQNGNSMKVTMTVGSLSANQTESTAGTKSLTLADITSSHTSATITFETTANKNVRLDDIVLTGYKATVAISSIAFSEPKTASVGVGGTTTLSPTVLPANHTEVIDWESDATGVATVNSSGVVTGVAAGTAHITAKAHDNPSTIYDVCTVTVTAAVPVTGVSLKSSTTLLLGETETLEATVSPNDATNKNVTWASADDTKVSVDENGVITGLALTGETPVNITVTTEDGSFEAVCAVTVNPVPVSSVGLNKTSAKLVVGKTLTLSATVSPDNATNKSVTWESDDTDVATVTSSGEVTAVAEGTATITVKSVADPTKSATCIITVTDGSIDLRTTGTITFGNPFTSDEIGSGGYKTQNCELNGSDGNTYTWAEVSGYYNNSGWQIKASTGKVTSPKIKSDYGFTISTTRSINDVIISDGTDSGKNSLTTTKTSTTITIVGDGGYAVFTKITITPLKAPVATDVAITDPGTLAVGGAGTFAYTAETEEDNTASWTSATTGVITITDAATGAYTAAGRGTSKITLTLTPTDATTYDAVTAERTVTVTAPVVITASNVEMTYGDAAKAIGATTSDGYAGTLTYASGNTSIATVDASGKVTAVAKGTTTITISAPADASHYYTAAIDKEITVTVSAPEGGTTAKTTTPVEVTSNTLLNNSLPTGWTGDGEIWSAESKYGAVTATGTIGSSYDLTTPSINLNGNYTAASVTFQHTGNQTFSTSGTGRAEACQLFVKDGDTETQLTINTMFAGNNWTYVTNTTDLTAYIGKTIQLIFRYVPSSGNQGKWEVKNFAVNATPAPVESVTLNGSGYATFCSQYPLDFTGVTDFSAWQITDIDSDNKITFERVTGSVKGGTGLFLVGENGATVTIPSTDSENTLGSNMLEGTLAPMYFDAGAIYGLAGDTFKKNNAGTIRANKAYIDAGWITPSAGVKAFTLVFEDDATGIRTVETVNAEDAEQIFNLAGQRIQKMQKGINIVNGKKILK